MRITALLPIATLFASGVVPAGAADLTYAPAPIVAALHDWTGIYFGGNAGYGWGKAAQQVGPDGIITQGASPDILRPDGFVAGLQIGGDYQFPNNVVIGALVDVYYSSASDTFHFDNGADSYATEAKIAAFGTGRIRAGYAIDRFLPYATGGFAWASGKIDDSDFGSDSNTHFGWVLGAGAEYAVAPNWSLRAEYLYMDYGAKTYTLSNSDGAYDVSLKSQSATLGVNYRF